MTEMLAHGYGNLTHVFLLFTTYIDNNFTKL